VKRRVFRLGAILVSALGFLSLVGCNVHEQLRRPRQPDDVAAESEEANESKRFFKSSRIPGALSSEAREVEQSLGVR
jgi:hypothetical protein